MADRGIAFNVDMVRAIMDERKTQTRRLLKLPPAPSHLGEWQASTIGGPGVLDGKGKETPVYPCVWHTRTGATVVPPFALGDRLYVREAYYQFGHWEPLEDKLTKGGRQKWGFIGVPSMVMFDEPEGGYAKARHAVSPFVPCWHKRLGRFMPRALSRTTLLVTDVRVQRLQDCSEADAIAEGVERIDDPRGTAWKSYETYADGTPHPHAVVPNRSALTSYAELWSSLHTTEGERWADNPWVVAVSFEVRKVNIGEVAQ